MCQSGNDDFYINSWSFKNDVSGVTPVEIIQYFIHKANHALRNDYILEKGRNPKA